MEVINIVRYIRIQSHKTILVRCMNQSSVNPQETNIYFPYVKEKGHWEVLKSHKQSDIPQQVYRFIGKVTV